MKTTITEALAELKTIDKRVEKKVQFVKDNLGRFAMNRDALEKEGGSPEVVRAERQAINDLQERTVAIRRAIAKANESEVILVNGASRSIADWLVWRREVAPKRKAFLDQIRDGIARARSQAKQKDSRVVEAAENANATDVVIHVSEKQLAEEIETMETILGALDGQLSLKNATVTIDV